MGVDPNNNDFEVTGASFAFSLLYKKSKDVLGLSWGIGFANGQDIINGKYSALDYPQSYLPFSLDFQGTTSLKGKVELSEAAFNSANNYTPPPKTLQLRNSKEPFTATFQGPGVSLRTAAGTVRIVRPGFEAVRGSSRTAEPIDRLVVQRTALQYCRTWFRGARCGIGRRLFLLARSSGRGRQPCFGGCGCDVILRLL